MKPKFKFWEEEQELNDYPLKKTKRIKNEFKRDKIKNNRSGSSSSGTTDKGGEGRDY
jgi:hypothetical protein